MKGKLTMLNTEQIQQVEALYKHFGKTELHRTEINELEEPFGHGQTASSSMPHKRNP